MIHIVTYTLNRYKKLQYYIGSDLIKDFLEKKGHPATVDNMQINMYRKNNLEFKNKIYRSFNPILPEIYQLESIIQLIKNYKNNVDLLTNMDNYFLDKEMVDNRMLIEFSKNLKVNDGDILGHQVLYLFIFHSLLVTLQVKMSKPNKKITTVFGGYHVTMSKVFRDFLSKFDFVDYIVSNDGRQPLLDIVENKITSKFLDGSFINPPLELPKYSKVERYIKKRQEMQLITSVGCPNVCKFCASSRNHVLLNLDYIKNYIIEQNKILPVKNVTFVDDLINPSIQRFNNLCKMIISLKEEHGIKIFWSAHAHPKDFNSDTFDLLKKSNCRSLFLGTESFDDDILLIIDKRTTTKQNINTIKELTDRKIYVKIGIILNLPFESAERFNNTIKTLDLINNEYVVIIPTIFKLYPDSEMYREKQNFGITILNWESEIVNQLDEIKGMIIPKTFDYDEKMVLSTEDKYNYIIDRYNLVEENEK